MTEPTTTGVGLLLALAIAFPLILAISLAWRGARANLSFLLAAAPVPALLVAIIGRDARFAMPGPFRLTLALDGPGAMLLGAASILWIAAGLYAPAYWQGGSKLPRAALWWLLTLTGSLGVFAADDLVSFYLLFSLVSLAAYGLVVLDGNSSVRRAGAVYVAFAVLGEAFLLMAFVLLASAEPQGSLAIPDVVAALPWSPWRDWTIALLILGFGTKMAQLPLHVWMPLSYRATPIPAVAALSGAAVKAGVIGLIRFLPFDMGSVPWGEALTILGFASAFYGVAIGITQTHPKTILAYSSISQMGVIAAVLGMGLAASRASVPTEVAFYAVGHLLAKGGLFLLVGIVAATGRWRLITILIPAAIVALGIAGLPLTGGGLAKLAVKDALGYGLAGTLGKLSAVASALLMFHFLRQLTGLAASADQPAPLRLRLIGWTIAAASILVPWILYPATGYSFGSVVSPGALFDGLWPIALGGALALVLRRWGEHLPAIQPGDILVPALRLAPIAEAVSAGMERTEARLREWPVAGAIFLALVLATSLAMYLAGMR
jgi:formate hydrogenlyase subunit 3/multisubunit Na+/H+ antiporter MnhD subunit